MLMSLALVLLAAAPKDGSYTFQGGAGTLVLGKGKFSIDVVGANAHLCQLSGEWKGEKGIVNDDGERCEVTFAAEGDQVKVSAEGEACRSYCGARAFFDGTYLTPPKGCTAAEVKKRAPRGASPRIFNRPSCTFLWHFEQIVIRFSGLVRPPSA